MNEAHSTPTLYSRKSSLDTTSLARVQFYFTSRLATRYSVVSFTFLTFTNHRASSLFWSEPYYLLPLHVLRPSSDNNFQHLTSFQHEPSTWSTTTITSPAGGKAP